MNINQIAEDSDDTSDEEYIPGSKPEEVVSEEDSDGEVEDPLSDSEASSKKTRGRSKRNPRKKLKVESPKSANVVETNENSSKVLTEEEKKKEADDLWADFLQDTNFKPKTNTKSSEINTSKVDKKTNTIESPRPVEKAPEKVKITEIFEFAGEEVEVEKEVPKDSAEARLIGTSSNSGLNNSRKKGSLSGIGSVLNNLGKKKKISTLEKTKLDWDKFKKDENITEELDAYKKGKDGYLERQDFLQRADLRTFEIEKDLRAIERNKRMNLGEPF